MPTASPERKLTAVVVADVVGYSRLTAADEEGTIVRLRDMKTTILDPAVARHHGRVVKTMGDGFLIEFLSVVDAVRSSLEVQRGLDDCKIESGSAPIRLRVGVHISDVIVEPDGDLLGDGVNIAARLQEIAEVGTVCLSEDAFHQVRNKISASFVDKGSVALKNIPQPVHVYALQGSERPLSRDMPSAGISLSPLSIVVLPFASLGGTKDDEQFTDGLTETLTTDLARIPHSAVIARNTAFTFKGKAVDARQIGRELRVRYILEGSVQRSGERIRVNVQLIDAERGHHLWADRFDKLVGDLLQMQDEIVARVANALKAPLIAAEAQRAERSPEPASLDLYFQGMAWINKGLRPDWLDQARTCFEKARVIDKSNNLDALIGIGMVDTLRGIVCAGDNPAGALESAEAALNEALSLAPDHAWAHCLLAAVLISTHRAERGITECERSLILNPSLASAHAMLGLAKYLTGRGEETEPHVEEALRLSPLDPFAYLWMLFAGVAKIQAEQYGQAIEWLRRSIETNTNSPWAHFHLAVALQLSGKTTEARDETQAGLALDPTFTTERYRSLAFSDNGRYLCTRERTMQALRAAGIP